MSASASRPAQKTLIELNGFGVLEALHHFSKRTYSEAMLSIARSSKSRVVIFGTLVDANCPYIRLARHDTKLLPPPVLRPTATAGGCRGRGATGTRRPRMLPSTRMWMGGPRRCSGANTRARAVSRSSPANSGCPPRLACAESPPALRRLSGAQSSAASWRPAMPAPCCTCRSSACSSSSRAFARRSGDASGGAVCAGGCAAPACAAAGCTAAGSAAAEPAAGRVLPVARRARPRRTRAGRRACGWPRQHLGTGNLRVMLRRAHGAHADLQQRRVRVPARLPHQHRTPHRRRQHAPQPRRRLRGARARVQHRVLTRQPRLQRLPRAAQLLHSRAVAILGRMPPLAKQLRGCRLRRGLRLRPPPLRAP